LTTSSELRVHAPSGGVVILTLDRPQKRNALDARMVEDIHAALDDAEQCDVRLVVLEGNGPSFCAGFDLSNLDRETDGDLLLRFVRIEALLHRLFSAPYVTLALAHGRVAGAGADLFVACDRRIIVDDAAFSFPGAGFGLVLGTGRLIGRIGADHARSVVRSGQTITAAQAMELGMATAIVTRDGVQDAITKEHQAGTHLDRETTAAIHAVKADSGAQDMAHLVWSAARPGLKSRILAYRDKVRSARAS
jgi:enoyl-CoA hydratase/carnithine racemase